MLVYIAEICPIRDTACAFDVTVDGWTDGWMNDVRRSDTLHWSEHGQWRHTIQNSTSSALPCAEQL